MLLIKEESCIYFEQGHSSLSSWHSLIFQSQKSAKFQAALPLAFAFKMGVYFSQVYVCVCLTLFNFPFEEGLCLESGFASGSSISGHKEHISGRKTFFFLKQNKKKGKSVCQQKY